jgi:diguanylate cyclase (GGDEF)-like protein
LDEGQIAVLIAVGILLVIAGVVVFIRRRDNRGAASLAPATMTMAGGGVAAASAMPAGPDIRPEPVTVEPAPTGEAPAEPEPTDGTEGLSPDVLIDPTTGLGTATAWDFALRHEEARFARYKEPATVVIAELEGYEMLAERLGREAADRLVTPIANALLRNSRRADRVARVGTVRFHVLLPKTDEITAINYVDRVREETDDWLAAGAVASRLVIGWASPSTGTSLADAMRVAEERMNADRRARRSQA